VQAICNWVHSHVAFNYQHARPTKTALDVYTERVGVCRDYQHLAITFCRALNIPARYATGYMGDIGVPVVLPMDFSAWFEVWLDGQWWTFDARNNMPRIGRVLMATGRDASDVAMTTAFAGPTCGPSLWSQKKRIPILRPGGTLESASVHLTLSQFQAYRSSLRACYRQVVLFGFEDDLVEVAFGVDLVRGV